MVAVRPFGDAGESFLAWWWMYRLENPYQILVRLKVKYLIFGTLNNQMSVSNSISEVANPSDSELRWMTQSCIFCILGK